MSHIFAQTTQEPNIINMTAVRRFKIIGWQCTDIVALLGARPIQTLRLDLSLHVKQIRKFELKDVDGIYYYNLIWYSMFGGSKHR